MVFIHTLIWLCIVLFWTLSGMFFFVLSYITREKNTHPESWTLILENEFKIAVCHAYCESATHRADHVICQNVNEYS